MKFEARHSLEAKFETRPTLTPGQNFVWDQRWGQNLGQGKFKPGQAIGARSGFVVCRELRVNQNTTGGTKWGEGVMKKRT